MEFPQQKNEGMLISNLKDHIKSNAKTFTRQCNSSHAINAGIVSSHFRINVMWAPWSHSHSLQVLSHKYNILGRGYAIVRLEGIIMSSEKQSVISTINYSRVQSVTGTAVLLSAKRPPTTTVSPRRKNNSSLARKL